MKSSKTKQIVLGVICYYMFSAGYFTFIMLTMRCYSTLNRNEVKSEKGKDKPPTVFHFFIIWYHAIQHILIYSRHVINIILYIDPVT